MDSLGNILDFMLSAKRNPKAAERFFRKMLDAAHTQTPRVINVDKNAAYPPAIDALKVDEHLPETVVLRKLGQQMLRWETVSVRSRLHAQIEPIQVASSST